MTHQPHKYRLRYFGPFGTLDDVEIPARDVVTAIGAAREAPWPPNAIGFRVVDVEGREAFEELRAERR